MTAPSTVPELVERFDYDFEDSAVCDGRRRPISTYKATVDRVTENGSV